MTWTRSARRPEQGRPKVAGDAFLRGNTAACLVGTTVLVIVAIMVLLRARPGRTIVALKLNPIMDAMLPVYRDVFAPPIDLGVLEIVTGASDVGGYLVQNDLVDTAMQL